MLPIDGVSTRSYKLLLLTICMSKFALGDSISLFLSNVNMELAPKHKTIFLLKILPTLIFNPPLLGHACIFLSRLVPVLNDTQGLS